MCIRDRLSIAVRADLTTLSGYLLADRLITQENVSELTDQRHSLEAERANRLVELVLLSVETNPKNYITFVGVLEKNRAHYKDTLNDLQRMYRDIEGEYFRS